MHEEKHVEGRGFKRHLVGRVVNDTAKAGRMAKTVVVEVVNRFRDPVYGKYVKRTSKVHAHDADNTCGEGDLVKIAPCRPISKTKAWRVVEIVERAESA